MRPPRGGAPGTSLYSPTMRQEVVLRRQLAVVGRHGLLIALTVVVAAAAAYLGSGLLPRVYEAQVTLLVGQALAPNAPDFDQLLTSQRLSQTYAQMATMRPIVGQVIERLGIPETQEQLLARVTAQSAADSLFLSIKVQDSDPIRAAEIANTFADELVRASPDVFVTAPDKGRANVLSIVEPANPPQTWISPRTLMNTLLAAVLTLMVAAGLAFVLEYLDDRLKSPGDVTDVPSEAPVIGVIHRDEASPASTGLAMVGRPFSEEADAYRLLRSQLGFTHPGTELRSMLVTGMGDDDALAEVASNIALAFAHAGSRTILVDADLQNPKIHTIFGQPNDNGLSNLVMSPALSPQHLSRESIEPLLRVITAGPPPARQAGLLTPARIGHVLTALREHCDVVILHAPIALDAGETASVAAATDGTMFVVDGGRTTRQDVIHVQEFLRRAGAHLTGFVYVRSAASPRGVRERFKATLDPSPGQRRSS